MALSQCSEAAKKAMKVMDMGHKQFKDRPDEESYTAIYDIHQATHGNRNTGWLCLFETILIALKGFSGELPVAEVSGSSPPASGLATLTPIYYNLSPTC